MSDVVVPLVLLLVVLLVLGAVGGIGWWVVRRRAAASGGADRAAEHGGAAVGGPDDGARTGNDRRSPAHTLPIRRLSPESRARYVAAWQGVQSRYPQRPELALSEADTILTSLLGELGFPLEDPREAVELLPEPHAQTLDSFRAGHALEQANSSTRSDDEQVREGMAHFAAAFRAVLEGGSAPYPDPQAAQASSAPR